MNRRLGHKTSSVVFIVFLLVFSTFGNASQDKQDSPEYRLNKRFIEDFARDFGRVASAPGSWHRRDLIRLSAIIASGTLAYLLDQDIHDWVQRKRSPTSDDVSRFFETFGNGYFLGSSLTALYLTGEILEDSKLRKISLLSLESWIISGVVVGSMKFLIGRARPHEEESSTTFHPFSIRSRHRSFPSGHASSAFAVATTIADHSNKFIVDALAYSLAVLAGMSRIHDGAHWASDVLIGAAIGYFISKKITAVHRGEGTSQIQVGFQFSARGQSLNIRINI